MIPRAAKLGRSFKGCAAYLLHDKRDGLSAEFAAAGDPDRQQPQTSERVAFTETVNLFTDDAQLAVSAMIDTARNAATLKRAHGGRGRAVEKPVYHYSLSWPREDTHAPPTREEMLEAARESMTSLGLQDHQAVLIAHTDEKHPHIHVMVNRVHPETGQAQSNYRDHNKLSKWAQGYQRERGLEHLTPQRVENSKRRDQGERVKYDAVPRQEYDRRKAQDRQAEAVKRHTFELKPPDMAKAEMAAHWKDYRAERDFKRAQMRQHHRPDWAGLYKRQNKEQRDFDSGLTGRIKEAMRQPKGKRFSAAMRSVFGTTHLRREMQERHAQERQALSKRHNGAVSQELGLLLERYRGGSLAIFKRYQQEKERGHSTPAPDHRPTRQQAVERRQSHKAQQTVEAARRVPNKAAQRVTEAERQQEAHRDAPRPARADVQEQFQHSARKPPPVPEKVRETAEKKTSRSLSRAKRTLESEQKRKERSRKRKPRKRGKSKDRGNDFGHEIDRD